jgi:hypothetical protein
VRFANAEYGRVRRSRPERIEVEIGVARLYPGHDDRRLFIAGILADTKDVDRDAAL